MGLASSSAVRADDAYGSLGGAFGGFGGGLNGEGRKLKKKPVLVLDPEELAKAHQLFQIGAAEQLGEFDPQARANRPAPPVFGTILGGAAMADDDDDYVAPLSLDEDEEEPEEDLPPIDLEALLRMSEAEQEEEDAFYREEAEAEPDFAEEVAHEAEEAEWLAPPPPEPESPAAIITEMPLPAIETASPADALARIISRAAAQPRLAPEPVDEVREEIAPVEPQPDLPEEAAELEPEPELEAAAEEPAWLAPEPLEFEALEEEPDESAAAPEPAPEPETFDLSPHDEFDGEAFVRPEAPIRVLPIIGEEGTRSQLRARLVREDLTLARPEPSPWRKLVIALRHWWNNL